MINKFLCVFDLDGTLYPKESSITYEIRKRVISCIASTKSISWETAEELYKTLPLEYPNPYDGLRSLGVSGFQYQEIFNSLNVENYIHSDTKLIALFQHLSKMADIFFVSFAPKPYLIRMLDAIGVKSFVKGIFSVGQENSYSKEPIFKALGSQHKYDTLFSIGDDKINDLVPAEKVGFKSFFVNFEEDGFDIYAVINNLNDFMMRMRIPQIMRVENTNSCNERCMICPYENSRRNKGEMDNELFEKIIIEHSSSVDNPKLIFPASIGEPFLDRCFLDKVSFASKYYTSIATFTNASMLSKDVFLKYIQCGGTELMLTLHGFTKKMHTYITTTELYDTVRSNIEMVAETNSAVQVPITLFLDVYAADSDDCMCFIAKMTDLGVNAHRIDIEKIHNWGGNINQYSKRGKHNDCHRIYEQFGVQYNGAVVPCCIDFEGKYILGDASKQSLKNIFSSSKYDQLVNLEKHGCIRNNSLCSLCNL